MDPLTDDAPTLARSLLGRRSVAGRYHVRARLGRGAWKEVYLAHDERLDRDVALAIVVGAGGGPAARARVRREAHVTGRLGDHPNVITVYDAGDLDGVPYFVMRAMAGGSLADAPRPSVAETVRLGGQIAAALSHAHAHGVVHRDVKPDNVWLDVDGGAALGDFGVAYEHDSDRLTAEGIIVGTARYLSPEQARGDRVGPRSDLYSLGVTIYELLTGRPPFVGDTIESIIAQHLAATPLAPSRHEPAVSPALDALVLGLLAKTPAERPESATAVAQTLEAIGKSGDADRAADAPAPPLRVVPRLELSSTSLIGRDRDIDTLVSIVRRPDVRLLTLTGTGGIGKTRLALAVGHAVQQDFRDGAYLVSLASITECELVYAAVVQRLGQAPRAAETMLQACERLLARRRTLLILDSFEHVLPAATGLADLLVSCPELVVIATSREALRISAERLYAVSPLSLPIVGEHAEGSAATELFTARAVAVDPQFALTASNRDAIGRICTRLDGLPLAIELAATRTALLGPAELLARLDNALSLLDGGARDAEPRHRTLRAAIDWSHDLLDEDERTAFCAFAVFAGGASVRAAEAVAGVGLRVIESLVTRNLVARRQMPDGQPRLLLLETIGEYARERLAADPDAGAIGRRHCDYFIELAETGAREMWGPRQMHWLAVFDEEQDNFRAAVNWSLQAGAAGLGLRLATAVMELWGRHRAPSQVASWIRSTLACASPVDDGLRGRALLGLAVGDEGFTEATTHAREALALALAANDVRTTCSCLRVLMITDESNRPMLAELAEQTLGHARGADDPGAVSIALETKGLACESFADARVYFEEAADVLRYIGDRLRAPGLLSNIGCMASEAAQEDLAVSVLDESIALARQTGDLPSLSVALSNRALVCLLQEDVEAADAMFRECLECCRDLGWSGPACEALTGLGDIAALAGQLERTAMLYGASAAIRDDTPLSVVEQRLYDRYVAPLRARGDTATWQNAWNHCRTLTSQQAIATGLSPKPVSRPASAAPSP